MLRFHEFSRTFRSTKTEKLLSIPKYATNFNLISGAILVYETSPFDYRFIIIKRVLSLL